MGKIMVCDRAVRSDLLGREYTLAWFREPAVLKRFVKEGVWRRSL